MLDKKKSAMDFLKVATNGEAEPAAPPMPAEPPARPRPAPALEEERVRTSITLPRDIYQRLREIAFRLDRPLNDIMLEAVGGYLKANGYPEGR